jgi:hypothetical protein
LLNASAALYKIGIEEDAFMIRFSLRCASGHEFEAWFRSGEGYEAQLAAAEIVCPECGDTHVEKALMAPSIGRSGKAGPPMSPTQMRAALMELRRQVESNCDYVGPQFAEEARKIHYGETDPHGIYGEASDAESRELAEEGVQFGRIPWIQPPDA